MSALIEARHLKKYFSTAKGTLHAVDDVSFSLEEGKTLGVVGESGCGKSTLGRVLIHLLEPTDGQIFFRGEDITKLKGKALKKSRTDMQMIFQDPFSSINPRMTVAGIIGEPLRLHKVYKGKEAYNKAVAGLMDTVGLAKRLETAYPHELDGGRRQRVGIARALALNPKFIVCDEPVSALDVSIQAQVLNLMQDLQEERKLSYLFITHDLSVVRHISDDICVMYLGTVVEKAAAKTIFINHKHPYTHALLSAIPLPRLEKNTSRVILKGELTSPINPGPGCRFAPRCIHAAAQCFEKAPELKEVEPNHFLACHYPEA